jgi:hypothetical protein
MIRVDPASVTTDPAPLPARVLIDQQLVMLTRLAEIGMEIAEEAGRQATGGAAHAPEGTPMPDPALAYTRVARAVRMTIALQWRLMDGLAALDRGGKVTRAERRARLGRLVERACEAEHAEGDETEHLRHEARERLADADIDAEIDDLTFAEVVARICGDLGLSPERTARIVAAAEEAGDASPAAVRPPGGPGLLRPRPVGARRGARTRAPPA